MAFASALGGSGVILGAFGAHALKATLEANGKKPVWETAVKYHLIHATAMFAVALHLKHVKQPQLSRAYYLWTIGVCLFSGSLYCLAIDIGPKKVLGPTTPIGGLFLIGGWTMAALSFM